MSPTLRAAIGLLAVLAPVALAACDADRADVDRSSAEPTMVGAASAAPTPGGDEVARVVIRGGRAGAVQREHPVRAGLHTVWIGCEGTGRVLAKVSVAGLGVTGVEAPCGPLASSSLGVLPDGARVDLEVTTAGEVENGWVVVDRQG